MTKPCEQSCPKCGSNDVTRTFRPRGEVWPTYRQQRIRESKFVRVGEFDARAFEDSIVHHCRVCQWDWETGPLHCQENPAKSGENNS